MKKKITLTSDWHHYTDLIKNISKFPAEMMLFAGDITSAHPAIIGDQLLQTRNAIKTFNKAISGKKVWEGTEKFGNLGNHDTAFDTSAAMFRKYPEREWMDRYHDGTFIESKTLLETVGITTKPFDIITTKDGLKILRIALTRPIDDIFGKHKDPWGFHFDYNGEAKRKIKKLIEKEGGHIDIINSHSPPYGYGDKTSRGKRVGSKFILDLIDTYKPKLVNCGHIHEGYGIYQHNDTVIVNSSLTRNERGTFNDPIVVEIDFSKNE